MFMPTLERLKARAAEWKIPGYIDATFGWTIPEGWNKPISPAQNAEPMRKPDHKAKRHSRPTAKRYDAKRAEKGERIGAGYFVFRRNDSGRIIPGPLSFEHKSAEQAIKEAQRLAKKCGGTFEVYERRTIVADAEGDE